MKQVILQSYGHNFTICLVSIYTDINIISSTIDRNNINHSENINFSILKLDNEEQVEEVYRKCQPVVFVTCNNDPNIFIKLNKYRMIKNVWINYTKLPSGETIARDVLKKFIENTLSFNDNNKISVITPTYNSRNKLLKPYLSLLEQTYNNWEWIIYDDCSTDKNTIKFIEKICEKDPRINFYTSNKNTGKIGQTKHICSQLSTGKYIVELDHDDQLHEKCLEYFIKTFDYYSDVGYASTDYAFLSENTHEPLLWGAGYTLGFGKYYKIGRAHV